MTNVEMVKLAKGSCGLKTQKQIVVYWKFLVYTCTVSHYAVLFFFKVSVT